jgi:hypothetical protein
MNIHCYYGIESLALTNPQRATLVQGLQQIGEANNAANPAQRNHWRIRPDNNAIIFEALFNEDHLTIAAIKQRLADIFGVNVSLITHTTSQSVYGLVVTFRYNSVNRLRSIAFGYNGGWPAYGVSQQAARDYLAANAAAWGDTE